MRRISRSNSEIIGVILFLGIASICWATENATTTSGTMNASGSLSASASLNTVTDGSTFGQDQFCACSRGADGTDFCHLDTSCAGILPCPNGDIDCGPGEKCLEGDDPEFDNCCGFDACVPICGAGCQLTPDTGFCNNFEPCPDCVCSKAADGTEFCHEGIACAGITPCPNGDSDCAIGQKCLEGDNPQFANCCGFDACVPVCGEFCTIEPGTGSCNNFRVCPQVPVPTASEWGLVILALTIMVSGSLVFRRLYVGPAIFARPHCRRGSVS